MSKTFTFALDEEMRERLEKIAVDEDRTLSYIVRKAIEEYLAKHQVKEEGN